MLEFLGLTKRYGSATVLSDVSLTLSAGRVHALMGENGAGKSTLIKLLAGVTPADSMEVRLGGRTVPLRTPADAARAGFRVIHQELNLIPQLSVAENILLGHPIPQRLGFVNWRALARQAEQALLQLDVTLDVTQQAGDLRPGDRMLVKIASALVGGQTPCLYVLDEPTAALSDAESARLFAVIHRLKQQGAAILYVSHRLSEVMAICDDVTILRNGQRVHSAPIAETSRDDIILHMTGRPVAEQMPARTPHGTAVVARADLSSPSLTNLNFTLHQGEVLGVAGLTGSGQSAVLSLFLGLEHLTQGTIDPAPQNPAQAWAQGIAYVPPERRTQGLALPMGARENALMPHHHGLRARLGLERSRIQTLAAQVNLKAQSPEQPVWQLSGGNQQKVVFARALANPPRLLLLDEPTRGVDVGARAEIYALIRDLTARGTAVILSSTDLPELLGLSDRILILHQGHQTEILSPDGLHPHDLLRHFYPEPA
jgi:ribose transport system ATP-binding protein